MYVDHIAFIIRDIETVTDSLPEFCKPRPIEEHPAEGTREQYIQVTDETAPSLLLMQPVSDGPYQRAMDKRGSGLHHIAAVTPSIHALLPTIQEHRLLLHPISLKTYEHNIIWLCRPGVPFLIELIKRDSENSDGIKSDLHLPAGLSIPSYIDGIFSNLSLHSSDNDYFRFVTGRHDLLLSIH